MVHSAFGVAILHLREKIEIAFTGPPELLAKPAVYGLAFDRRSYFGLQSDYRGVSEKGL